MTWDWKLWVGNQTERILKSRGPIVVKELAWQTAKFARKCGRSNPISFALRHIAAGKGFKRGVGLSLVGMAVATGIMRPWPSFAENTGGMPSLTVASAGDVNPATKAGVKIPIEHFYVSQGFWLLHGGVDLASDMGEPIHPVMNGIVKQVENNWFGYGNLVIISHGQEYESWYAHLSVIKTKVGDQVTTDNTIGLVGSTGRSTGPHLHLEIHENGTAINPAPILGL